MTRTEWHQLIDSKTDQELADLHCAPRSAWEAHVVQANAIDERLAEMRAVHDAEKKRQRQEDREDAARLRGKDEGMIEKLNAKVAELEAIVQHCIGSTERGKELARQAQIKRHQEALKALGA